MRFLIRLLVIFAILALGLRMLRRMLRPRPKPEAPPPVRGTARQHIEDASFTEIKD